MYYTEKKGWTQLVTSSMYTQLEYMKFVLKSVLFISAKIVFSYYDNHITRQVTSAIIMTPTQRELSILETIYSEYIFNIQI